MYYKLLEETGSIQQLSYGDGKMLELIIIIIVIVLIVRSSRKKKRRQQTQQARPANQAQQTRQAQQVQQAQPKKVRRPDPVNQAKAAKKAAAASREEVIQHKATAGKYSIPRSDLRSGIRHEEWQPVPNGYTVRRCGYCAAENAIPASDDPKKYRCYFCHVQL